MRGRFRAPRKSIANENEFFSLTHTIGGNIRRATYLGMGFIVRNPTLVGGIEMAAKKTRTKSARKPAAKKAPKVAKRRGKRRAKKAAGAAPKRRAKKRRAKKA